MAASLASIMIRSDDARSRVASVLESAELSSKARLSRKARRRSSSSCVRMPSVSACANPSFRAWSMSWSVARERLAMAPRVLPEGGLVEGVGTGGLGDELDHLLPAGPVGFLAVLVVPLQEAGLLAAETAGAL